MGTDSAKLATSCISPIPSIGPAAGSAALRLESTLIGRSKHITEIRRLIAQVARSRASVLITGPSGTGKEVVARSLHDVSDRSGASFVPVNCGAIPRELLESELFGHEKGAFTGALQARKGRFEAAHDGTIFLDEIGDMPADMQVKLLRVLEERQIERIGCNKTITVDVRVISATHRNIEQAIADGRFREDLFYRLNVFPIRLRALAERREDVPDLVAHFLRQLRARTQFSPGAIAVLCDHAWPGNLRELRNVVERAAILFPEAEISADDATTLITHGVPRAEVRERTAVWHAASPVVPDSRSPADGSSAAIIPLRPNPFDSDPRALIGTGSCDMRALVAELEQSLIRAAIDSSDGVIADAARLLGLQRTSLIEKMRKYNIARGE